MAVVTIAMMTIIVNSRGLRTPRSRPTFSTTSSISPRVFIRMPRRAAKRHSSPTSFRQEQYRDDRNAMNAQLTADRAFGRQDGAVEEGAEDRVNPDCLRNDR